MRNATVLVFSCGVALASAALAQAPAKPKAPKVTSELLATGRASFEVACATCHGSAGDGSGPAGQYLNPRPRAFGKEPFKQGGSVEEVFVTLQTGVANTPMVSFAHLSEQERWALAHYVTHFLPTKDGKKAKKLVDALPPLPAPPPVAPAPAPPAAVTP